MIQKEECSYSWLVCIGETASSEVRQAYKQFIGAVVALVDGELRSEDFNEVALTVYRLFSRPIEEGDSIDRIIYDKK